MILKKIKCIELPIWYCKGRDAIDPIAEYSTIDVIEQFEN